MPKGGVDFGKELKELEAIVEWFEGEEVDLDKALAKFERGMELAERLKKHLAGVENKVSVIKKKFDQGSAKPAAADTNLDGIVETDQNSKLL